jgi:hypothetical protein
MQRISSELQELIEAWGLAKDSSSHAEKLLEEFLLEVPNLLTVECICSNNSVVCNAHTSMIEGDCFYVGITKKHVNVLLVPSSKGYRELHVPSGFLILFKTCICSS